MKDTAQVIDLPAIFVVMQRVFHKKRNACNFRVKQARRTLRFLAERLTGNRNNWQKEIPSDFAFWENVPEFRTEMRKIAARKIQIDTGLAFRVAVRIYRRKKREASREECTDFDFQAAKKSLGDLSLTLFGDRRAWFNLDKHAGMPGKMNRKTRGFHSEMDFLYNIITVIPKASLAHWVSVPEFVLAIKSLDEVTEAMVFQIMKQIYMQKLEESANGMQVDFWFSTAKNSLRRISEHLYGDRDFTQH